MSRAGKLSAAAAVLLALLAALAWQGEATATPGDVVSLDGAVLFQAKGCAACHAGPDSTPEQGSSLLSLVGAPSWAGDRRPDLTAAAYLAESVREPWAFIAPDFSVGSGDPANAMPALELSEAEIAAIVDYLLAD